MTVYKDGFEQSNLGDWNFMTVASTSSGSVAYTWINGIKQHPSKEDFIPIKIIFNNLTTICIFPDGEKIVVRCSDGEVFSKENGVMAAIIKKLFNSRNAFKKLVESGHSQPPKEN
jgi:hypothetical protein